MVRAAPGGVHLAVSWVRSTVCVVLTEVPGASIRFSLPENVSGIRPLKRDRDRPWLDAAAAAYVRRACGLCVDMRCTSTASHIYRRGTAVVSQSKPMLYCEHEDLARRSRDATLVRQWMSRLRRDLGFTI